MFKRKIIVATVCYFCSSVQISYAATKINEIFELKQDCKDESVVNSLLCGQVSGRLKTLYYSTHHAFFVEDLNQDTIAAGGFLKYETQPFLGFKLGVSYAGQWRLDDNNPHKNEVSELKFERDGLAEAYFDWKQDDVSLRIGQQALDLPFVGNYDWRVMPVLYRAADFKYGNQHDFIRLTALDRFKSYADDQFTKTSRYSQEIKTDGIWSVGLGKSYEMPQQQLTGQIWYQSYDNYNYLAYAEGHVKFKKINYQPDLGIQMMYAKDQGKAYAGNAAHQGIGVSLALSVLNDMQLTTSYNYIKPNKNNYLNGALFAPYMIYTASGPYFAQPFFTSTQDLGAGHAAGIALEGNLTPQTYVGARYSFMNLKEADYVKALNQSEYILYAIHNFGGAFKGWSLSNFAGVSTSPRSDKTFLQNRLGLTYQF